MAPLVRYAVERGVATATLDSPANRNALSSGLVTELSAHLAEAAADEDVRAVVLTHTGTVFCAGADLTEQTEGPDAGTRRMLDLMRTIVELPKPVVASLDGAARAGGIGLVGACDIAIASPATTFAFTEVRLGLAPAIISLTTLGRLTERAAARYYLTGEKFDAHTAAEFGLLTQVSDEPATAVAAVCDALRLASPQSLAEVKPLTTARARAALAAGADEMRELSARLFASDEAREGMLSFLEKRPPRWAVPQP